MSWLLKWAEDLPKGEPVTKYSYFTALKLIAVHYYSSVFVKVVNSQIRKGNADAAVYVDLLAGTGLVSIKKANPTTHLAGSPICAASTEYGGFGYTVCVESDAAKCDALKRRLKTKITAKRFAVIHGDCNEKVDDVISSIKSKYKNPIVLVFVDPEAFEVKFKTLLRLSEAFERCDFMIHVNSQAVKRERGKITHKSNNASPKVLEDLFNMTAMEIFDNLTRSPEQQYEEIVKDKLGKEIGDAIEIHSTTRCIAYHILCYTRYTTGGSGYANSIKKLKENLEKVDADSVKRHIDILCNRQQTLDTKMGRLDGFLV